MAHLFRKKNETIFGTGNSPLAGGRVHYYIAGTTTRLDTYADQAGSTINDNPVILNADGDFPTNVYLGEANDYKEVIETADSSSSTTIDNIPKAQAATTTLLVQSPSFVWTTVSALNTILDETQVGKAFAANTQNNNVTFLLPNPALSQNGPTLVFKKINASNSLVLQDHLGGAFLTIDSNGDSVFLSSNGAEWHVVSDLNSEQGGASAASGFKVYMNADLSIPADTSTRVAFNQSEISDLPGFSHGTYEYTAQSSGVHSFDAGVNYKMDTTPVDSVTLGIYLNGVLVPQSREYWLNDWGDQEISLNSEITVSLSGGDVVDVRVTFEGNNGLIEADSNYFIGRNGI